MTNIVDDFADIRSRMKGEDKVKPKVETFSLAEKLEEARARQAVNPSLPGKVVHVVCQHCLGTYAKLDHVNMVTCPLCGAANP